MSDSTLTKSQSFTPGCWNGADYNPADPHAHMRYPECVSAWSRPPDAIWLKPLSSRRDYWNGKKCPKSHPRRLPVILLESFHSTDNGQKSGIKLPKAGQPHYSECQARNCLDRLRHVDLINTSSVELTMALVDQSWPTVTLPASA